MNPREPTLGRGALPQAAIIDLHWFQTGKELASTPLVKLIQEAVDQLAYADIYPYCQHEDWLDMF